MRLQKYLARAGIASRRASEDLIVKGRVSVNGVQTKELGTKVSLQDIITVDGKKIEFPDKNITLMLNKPAGYVTTMNDTHGRPTVAQLIPIDEYPSLFPVGRLDMDTTGLLLFTTEGDLGNRLLHPKFHVDKTYIACINGVLAEEEASYLRNGIVLEDGKTAPAVVRLIKDKTTCSYQNTSCVEITIHEGRKRQVRRMFDAIGHTVVGLERVSFGSLQLGDLKSGQWRLLTEDELTSISV